MDELLKSLIEDEKRNNTKLYSAGPYWAYKNKKTIHQLKKNGLYDFRGMNSGVGTSFADNLVLDIRNEFNLKGRLISLFTKLPFLKKIFDAQKDVTLSHIKNYIKTQSVLYEKDKLVEQLIEKYKFDNSLEFGCIQKFFKNDKEYSCFYLEIANRTENLSKFINFKNLKSYFEIGGGFGANIHFLINNFENIKKVVYLDIVPNLFVGTEYLKKLYGNSVIDYLKTKHLSKINFRDDNNLEILCIAPWQIEKLNVKCDHFHNAASFVEMPLSVIENYSNYINKISNSVSLISYDQYDDKTFEPEKLNKFFGNQLKIFKHYKVIKELKREDIYLIKS